MKIWPEFADEKTVNYRLLHCNICDKNKFGICRVCNCVITLKTKLKSESCPENKWPSQQVIWANQV